MHRCVDDEAGIIKAALRRVELTISIQYMLLLPDHAAAIRLGPNASQSSAVQTLHSRIMDESLLLQLNQNTRKGEPRPNHHSLASPIHYMRRLKKPIPTFAVDH